MGAKMDIVHVTVDFSPPIAAVAAEKNVTTHLGDEHQIDATKNQLKMQAFTSAEVIADALITLLRKPSPPFASPGAGALKAVKRLWQCIGTSSYAHPSSPSASSSSAVRARRFECAVMMLVLRALLAAHAHEPARPAVAALARSLAAADVQIALGVLHESMVERGRREAVRIIWCDWAQAIVSGSGDGAEANAGGVVALAVWAVKNANFLDDGDAEGQRVWTVWESLLDSCVCRLEDIAKALFETVSAYTPDNRDGRTLALMTKLVASVLGRVFSTQDSIGEVFDAANVCFEKTYALILSPSSSSISSSEDAKNKSQTGLELFKILATPILAGAKAIAERGDGDAVINRIKGVERGLEIWFADEKDAVEDREYTLEVRVFLCAYCRVQ